MFASLIKVARRRAIQLTGYDLQDIVWPVPKEQVESTLMISAELQLALAESVVSFHYHFPKDPRIQALLKLNYKLVTVVSHNPVSGSTVFTDGTKTHGAIAYKLGEEWKNQLNAPPPRCRLPSVQNWLQ